MKWNKIAYHKDEVVEKSELPALPENFSPSTLGYPKPGSRAQYRGPDGLHVHEYDSYWEVHRDYSDPSTLDGAIAHAVLDATGDSFNQSFTRFRLSLIIDSFSDS